MALRGPVIQAAQVVIRTSRARRRGTGPAVRARAAVTLAPLGVMANMAGAVEEPLMTAVLPGKTAVARFMVLAVVAAAGTAQVVPRSAGLAARGVLILQGAAVLAVQRAVQRLHKLGPHMIPDAAMVAAAGPVIRRMSLRPRAALGVSPAAVAAVVEPMRGEI